MNIGSKVKGTFHGIDYTGVIAAADCGLSIDVDVPFTYLGSERDGFFWDGRDPRVTVELTGGPDAGSSVGLAGTTRYLKRA